MATTYTPRAKFAKPDPAQREWNIPLNANADALDDLAPIGGLCVTPVERPSATLRLNVAAGRFQRRDGTVGEFEGATSIVLPANSTCHVYLTDDGHLLISTSGFPGTSHVPLAVASTGSSAVSSVTDVRIVCGTVGSDSRPFLTAAGGIMNDGASFASGTSSGLKIGTSAAQRLGFWNATPIPRPGPYTQSYTTSSRNLAAYSTATSATSFTGLSSGQSGVPYAQVADLNSLRIAHENLRAFAENSTQLLNAVINDLKAMGLLG